ncbi:unnamed protein product [Blepharisma stoltei]|uniref:Uncharacterized protein n=1 Tax=Blepharisma stoltei TaxID=1481888 RepID=A0AAU9JQD0_9CILI|nr:unnamed protein product [Blepharisma stoltei]
MEEHKKYFDMPLIIGRRIWKPPSTSESSKKLALDPVNCWNLPRGEGRKIPGVIKRIRAKQFRIKRKEDFSKTSRSHNATPESLSNPFEFDKKLTHIQEQLKSIDKINTQACSKNNYMSLLNEDRPLIIDTFNDWQSQKPKNTKKSLILEDRPLSINTNHGWVSEKSQPKEQITPSFQSKKVEMIFESTGGSDDILNEEAQTVPTEMSFSDVDIENSWNFSPNYQIENLGAWLNKNQKNLDMPRIISSKSLKSSTMNENNKSKILDPMNCWNIPKDDERKMPGGIKKIRARQFRLKRKEDDCLTCRSYTPVLDPNPFEFDKKILQIQKQLENIEKISSGMPMDNKLKMFNKEDRLLLNNKCYDWKVKRVQNLKRASVSASTENRPLAIDTSDWKCQKSNAKQPITPSFQSKKIEIKFESTGGSDDVFAEEAQTVPTELSFSEENIEFNWN